MRSKKIYKYMLKPENKKAWIRMAGIEDYERLKAHLEKVLGIRRPEAEGPESREDNSQKTRKKGKTK